MHQSLPLHVYYHYCEYEVHLATRLPLTIISSLRFATRILPVLNSVCPCFRRIIAFSAGLYAFDEHPGLALQRWQSRLLMGFHTWGWLTNVSCTMYKWSPCLLCRSRHHTALTCMCQCPDVQGDSDAFHSAIIATAEPSDPFPADGITAQDTESCFWTPFYQAVFN